VSCIVRCVTNVSRTVWSAAEVAQALLVDETTVRNWFQRYQQGGQEELLAINYRGKEPSLSTEQQAELAKHLDETIYLDSNAIRRHIETIYGVKYSPTGVKELLHRLSFVYKKLKHVPGKCDTAKAKVIHIIVDNATYYQSQLVQEYLKTSRIKIHFLPGYSPNLHLIERLWKFFKKKILYNKYYETFDKFLSVCKKFFRCRTKYREELRSLLAENFYLYQPN